jgi:hypothetical protein
LLAISRRSGWLQLLSNCWSPLLKRSKRPSRRPISIDRIVHCIEVITDYIAYRASFNRKSHRPPEYVLFAARTARATVNPSALYICREWLSVCPYAPPSRVGACNWDLGAEVEHFIKRNQHAIAEAIRAA